MSRIAFTAPKIQAFKCPPDKAQVFIWDANALGLGLRLTPNGKPAYIFQGSLQGKAVRITIGSPDAWTIPQAQTKARELQRLIDEGTDPRTLKRQAVAKTAAYVEEQAQQLSAEQAQALTVGEVWEAYIDARRPRWGQLHLADHINMMAAGGKPKQRGEGLTRAGVLNHFADMRLIDVTPAAVSAWANKEAETRKTRTRLAINLLHAFLNWCAEQPQYAELVPDKNPARNKSAREIIGKAKAKQDALLSENLPAWFAAVRELPNPTVRAYLQALLLTGARPNELLRLRWGDISASGHGLTIRDKDESKGGLDGTRTIPLTPYVSSLIHALPRRSSWVFSNDTLPLPITPPNNRLTEACAIAGIEHLTLQGLRRSFGTLSEWIEAPVGVIAQIQGHKPSATAEKHYRRRPLDLLRLHHIRLEAWILDKAGVQFDPDAELGKLRLVSGAKAAIG